MREIDLSLTNTSSASERLREIDLSFTNTSSAREIDLRLTLVLLILALHERD